MRCMQKLKPSTARPPAGPRSTTRSTAQPMRACSSNTRNRQAPCGCSTQQIQVSPAAPAPPAGRQSGQGNPTQPGRRAFHGAHCTWPAWQSPSNIAGRAALTCRALNARAAECSGRHVACNTAASPMRTSRHAGHQPACNRCNASTSDAHSKLSAQLPLAGVHAGSEGARGQGWSAVASVRLQAHMPHSRWRCCSCRGPGWPAQSPHCCCSYDGRQGSRAGEAAVAAAAVGRWC